MTGKNTKTGRSPKETADIVRKLKRQGKTEGQAIRDAATLTGKQYKTAAKNYRDAKGKPAGGKGNGKGRGK